MVRKYSRDTFLAVKKKWGHRSYIFHSGQKSEKSAITRLVQVKIGRRLSVPCCTQIIYCTFYPL